MNKDIKKIIADAWEDACYGNYGDYRLWLGDRGDEIEQKVRSTLGFENKHRYIIFFPLYETTFGVKVYDCCTRSESVIYCKDLRKDIVEMVLDAVEDVIAKKREIAITCDNLLKEAEKHFSANIKRGYTCSIEHGRRNCDNVSCGAVVIRQCGDYVCGFRVIYSHEEYTLEVWTPLSGNTYMKYSADSLEWAMRFVGINKD